jgi:hypothetical protein
MLTMLLRAGADPFIKNKVFTTNLYYESLLLVFTMQDGLMPLHEAVIEENVLVFLIYCNVIL